MHRERAGSVLERRGSVMEPLVGEQIRLRKDVCRRAMRRSGLSQKAIAKRMHVHYKTLSKWINNRQSPSFDKVAALAEILGTSPHDLIENHLRPAVCEISDLSLLAELMARAKARKHDGASEKRRISGIVFNLNLNIQISTELHEIESILASIATGAHAQGEITVEAITEESIHIKVEMDEDDLWRIIYAFWFGLYTPIRLVSITLPPEAASFLLERLRKLITSEESVLVHDGYLYIDIKGFITLINGPRPYEFFVRLRAASHPQAPGRIKAALRRFIQTPRLRRAAAIAMVAYSALYTMMLAAILVDAVTFMSIDPTQLLSYLLIANAGIDHKAAPYIAFGLSFLSLLLYFFCLYGTWKYRYVIFDIKHPEE